MRDEIIKMAREAGMVVYEGDQDRVLFAGSVIECLTRFFHMAQAAEREECAKEVDFILRPGGGTMGDTIRARGQA